MGYRVGMQCFESRELAQDYVLSQVPPLLTENAVIHPVKSGSSWIYQGQIVELSFPECSAVEQIQLGALLAAPVIVLAGLVFAFRGAIWLVNHISKDDGGGDD